jgi:hypothetical protein
LSRVAAGTNNNNKEEEQLVSQIDEAINKSPPYLTSHT